MKNKLTEAIKRILFPLLIILLCVCLAYKNYTPNTFLTGWDALHPEFNFKLAFERMFSGVWRSDQGLGTLAAHSHMADLPRVVFLWLSSFLLPINLLRYFYIFATAVIGPLGMYLLVKETVSGKKNTLALFAAFLSAVYYLLNLGTMQHFVVPFEMFNTQFAFMPLLFLFAWSYVQKGEKKLLTFFGLFSLFATPMAYASSLFFAYFGALILFLITYWLLMRLNWLTLKRVAVILTTIIFTNLYWLLPNIYSIINQAETINTSKINQLFTPEAFLFNKSYGTLDNILINKNFLFSWKGYDFGRNEFVDLLSVWKDHLGNVGVTSIGYAFAAFAILGIIFSFVKQHKFGMALFPTLIFSLFFLINENPPVDNFYKLLRTSLPIFGEGYRMAFTKFSLIYIFTTAYFVGYFLYTLFEFGKPVGGFWKTFSISAKWLFGIIVLATNLYYMYPAFLGNFISIKVRIDIPQEYFQVYKKIEDLDAGGRVAKLPINTPFNWEYHSWGYEGSGWFSWFFSHNAQLDRDFDRFSNFNETSYNELSFYLYQKDTDAFEKVLQKYNIQFILFDNSVINPGADPKSLFIDDAKNLLADAGRFQKVFSGEFLTLYRVINIVSDEVSILTNPQLVNRSADKSNRDLQYQRYGNYINVSNGVALPFSDIGSEDKLKVDKNGRTLHLTLNLVDGLSGGELYIPDYFESEEHIPVAIFGSYAENTFRIVLRVELPFVVIDGQKYGGNSVEKIYLVPTISRPKYIAVGPNVFSIDNLSADQSYIGNIFTKADSQLRIGLYLEDQAALGDLVTKLINNVPRSCTDATVKYLPEPISESGFALRTSSASACQGENFDVFKESLLNIDFTSSSSSDIFPQLCVTGENYRKCLSEQVQEAYIGKEGVKRKFKFKLVLSPGKYWLDFVIQAKGSELVDILYDDIRVDAHPVNFVGLVPISTDFADMLGVKKIDIDHSISNISSTIPLVAPIKENLLVGRGHPSGYNCDVLDVGVSQKEVKDGLVKYKAKDGAASCDYYDYPQLYYDQGYLLNLQGNNVSGRGLKFYLFNKDNARADLQDLLPPGDFNESYWVYPKKITNSDGYTLNTEVRSFGRISGESIISDITFYPIPLNWLSGITITPTKAMGTKSDTFISDYDKLSNHLYKADVSGKKGGYVVLNQGFDPGWVAFDISNGIFSAKKLEHVKVNSWENGWIVEDNSVGSGKWMVEGGEVQTTIHNTPITDHRILIIFWPQYLEFAGFAILGIGAVWLVFFYRDKHPRLKKALKD